MEIYFKDYRHHSFVLPTARETELLTETLKREKIDVIGISVRAGGYWRFAAALTARLKKELGVPVIWGGMHATMAPEQALSACDAVIIGEGEDTLAEFMEAMDGTRTMDSVRGIYFRSPDGGTVRNALRPLRQDLDGLPFRDFHSAKYKYFIENNRVHRGDPCLNQTVYLMMSARGCLFSCSYCDISALRRIFGNSGNFYRTMSPERMTEECLYALNTFKNLRRFRFDDELFCLNEDHVRRFCTAYKEQIGLPFEILTDPRVVDYEKFSLLKEAGLDTVMMGIQHIAQVNRRLYNRNVSDEKVREAAGVLHRLGLKPCYQILLDDPHVTSAEKAALFELLCSLPRPFDIYLFSLSYWPQTDITERYLTDGTITLEDVEGLNDKCLKQFRVDLSWSRPAEDTFWYSLYSLLSKPVPVRLIRKLAQSSFLKRHPLPLQAAAQVLNFLKLAGQAVQILIRGELTWDMIIRWVNLKSLAIS